MAAAPSAFTSTLGDPSGAGGSIRLSHVGLDTPCLGLQLICPWILRGTQLNQYLTRFAYLSFSTVKAHKYLIT